MRTNGTISWVTKDVFSRRIIACILQASIRQKDVVALMRYLDLRYGLKGVIIRNDNGSQFIANLVRKTLLDLEGFQGFTHRMLINESFHSIQQRELMDRFFYSLALPFKTDYLCPTSEQAAMEVVAKQIVKCTQTIQ